MFILPSRGRPHLLQRFFDHGRPTLPGVVVLDEDDAHHYLGVRYPKGWEPLVGPRRCIVEKCNGVFELFPDKDWYGITNDDVLPKTPAWDVKLRYACGPFNFAYGNDGLSQRYSTAVHSGDLIRSVGWLLCPALKHFYTDDAWELFKEIGLGIYLPDVDVQHMHFTAGLAPVDQTYLDRGDPEEDRMRFEKWLETEWPTLKERIQGKLAA